MQFHRILASRTLATLTVLLLATTVAWYCQGLLDFHDSLLHVASLAKNLALCNLCIAPNLRPRPDSMGDFRQSIDMIQFQVVTRATFDADLTGEELLTALSHPESLIFSLLILIFVTHKLAGDGSNARIQGQSLLCYQLHYPRMDREARIEQARHRGQNPADEPTHHSRMANFDVPYLIGIALSSLSSKFSVLVDQTSSKSSPVP
jgi:hypothetical protein